MIITIDACQGGRAQTLLAAFLLLLLPICPAFAQGWIGLSQSNYGGVHNAYGNPSSIADSRHSFYLSVVGGDVNFYNTYLQLDLPQAPWKSGFSLSDQNLHEQLTGGPEFASVSAELRLPSLQLSLGRGRALAFSNRARGFVQASNVSENLARLGRYGLGEAGRLGLANRLLEDNSFNINLSTYHEFALTYAQTLTPNARHFFKVGATIKYLAGLGGGYMLNSGTRYRVYSRDSIQLDTPHLSYGFVDNQAYKRPGFTVGSLYGDQRLGRGFGADLGLTYEWRPDYEKYNYHMDGKDWTDPSRNKYRLRLGLALTDLGAISYANDQYVRQATLVNSRVVNLGKVDTIHFNNLATFQNTARKLVGLQNESRTFRSYLPATLRFSADYRLVNHLFAGLLWTQNLLPASTIGSRSINSLALTPRIEFSHLELAAPLILANNYRKLQVGAMVRLGPLIVGSDNVGGLAGITTTTGADFYFGLTLALQRHRLKDKDGDQVSNKLDKCPKVKGTWEFKGCPDTDGDHVPDSADECPTVAGLPQFKGCPDTDGDGIPDKLDACPTVAGLPELKGCPDRDHDGITDADDACPDAAGLPELKGCPDRDHDGTTDADDHCPDLAGPADHAGCPDSDHDGLYDDQDQCPAVAGPAENKGCPWGDQDHDEVLDKDDACPTEAGPADNKGCPYADQDQDGVLDKDDACPLTPGPATNKGCPVLKAAEIKVLRTAFANLEFETNKDVIRPGSLPSLHELAALLLEKPEFRLRLSGYTDNVGTPAANLLLAKRRALAVQRYLVQQGVLADHIRAEWFGRARPVASNATAAGRARNRRVEMQVRFD
jgi:outer membrane protein OmpA-like peptidoglycan-associated protein